MARWPVLVPLVALAALGAGWGNAPGPFAALGIGALLAASVMAAVYHAERIAHRLGDPFGTLVLALAVTIIEVALIVSMMLSVGADATTLARDTVFATVMIVCNGIVGVCLFVGAIRHHVLEFRVEGTTPALSVLAALTTLTMVVPTFTTSAPGPHFSGAQLVFAGLMSLVLYLVFVFVQTVLHREYFMPVILDGDHAGADDPPSTRTAATSLVLLFASLVAVVGLAKALAPVIESGLQAVGAPAAVIGIAIALLVLMPESVAALRAAAANRMQTSLNLALGSSLATIGLTIPAVAGLSIATGMPLALGLPPKETVLLALTLLVSATTLSSGRATVLQAAVHLVIFAAFLFLAFVP